ncbi:glycosyltransferase family 2 protein [Pelagovum sp. HNIBRBA483]|uniref:glycosyltransferase n=1 Tax=Pelagovum sp. HNIBRBA483 TaxID=3233341 RepID=UPI0034A12017
MSEAPLKISVVIPHLNAPENLAACLASLKAGVRVPDEIIVVDNGSDALPEDACAGDPRVTLLQEREAGPGPARNKGSAAARGDVLAFIDCDCVADAHWLAVAEREILRGDRAVLGGAVIVRPKIAARRTALEAYEAEYAYRMDRYIAAQGFTGTGNMIVRRTVFAAVGPFAGIAVAEDRDWGQRAQAMGHAPTYVADMVVYHPARESFSELAVKWDRQLAHDYHAAKARRGGRWRFAMKALALLASPVVELPRIAMSKRLQGVGERIGAFAVLSRIRWHRAWTMLRLLAGADPEHLTRAWGAAQKK